MIPNYHCANANVLKAKMSSQYTNGLRPEALPTVAMASRWRQNPQTSHIVSHLHFMSLNWVCWPHPLRLKDPHAPAELIRHHGRPLHQAGIDDGAILAVKYLTESPKLGTKKIVPFFLININAKKKITFYKMTTVSAFWANFCSAHSPKNCVWSEQGVKIIEIRNWILVGG